MESLTVGTQAATGSRIETPRMKAVAIGLVLLVLFAAPALAVPTQSEARLAVWGKANHALRGFHASVDDATGATDFIATVTVDGASGEFHAEPVRGRVHREYVDFNVSDTWAMFDHLNVMRDALRTIYGAAIADDFERAQRNRPRNAVILWKGKRFGYAAFGSAFFVFQLTDLPAITQHVLYCDAIDCSD